MRIITGKYRGRSIPFYNKKFHNADVTTDKVKEALFSMIDNLIDGANFLDLFSCSGQIGFEAISRGAGFVAFNEIDMKRYSAINEYLEIMENEKFISINKNYKSAMKFFESKEYKFDILFLDPPYNKKNRDSAIYKEIFEELSCYNILEKNAVIIIQHFRKNDLPETFMNFEMIKHKKYGNNCLSVYTAK